MRSRRWTRAMWAALLVLSLAGLTFLSPAGLTDGPLRFRLQEGDLFAYRDKQKVETSIIDVPGQVLKLNFELDWIIEQRVVGINAKDGSGIIESQFKDLEIALGMSGALPPGVSQAQVDEAMKQASQQVTELFKPLLKEPFKATLTPRGEIKKVEASKLLKALKALENSVTDAVGSLDILSESTLKHNLIVPGLVYPKLDEFLWESKMEIAEEIEGQPFNIQKKLDWSRQGEKVVKKIPSHILQFTGEGKLADEYTTLQIEGVEVALDLKSNDLEGTVHVSKEDLWPVKSKIVEKLTLSVTGDACGSIETITMQMKNTRASERLSAEEYEKL